MVNTNGVRIATDEGFAETLASYMPGIELYLQFDSLEEAPLRALRGADLREIRAKALDRLDALGVSTTLVVTVKKGLNDSELGRIVEYALERPCVRGVTFQPVQEAGRLEGYDPARDRLTLGGVRRRILEQTSVFAPEDLVPVPCHPDAIAMAYALKQGGAVTPLTGLVPPEVLLAGDRSTIAFERDEEMKERLFDCLSAGHSPSSGASTLQSLLCCLPRFVSKRKLGYENLFRVIIMEFLDAASFDVRSVKKSCVHIVHPETLRPVPFDTYNLFYRPGLEKQREAAMRRSGLEPAPALRREG
jgi:tetraether lipid synthase